MYCAGLLMGKRHEDGGVEVEQLYDDVRHDYLRAKADAEYSRSRQVP